LSDGLDTAGAAVWLAEQWMAKLGGAVEMMTEARPELKLGARLAAGAAEVAADALWYCFPLTISAETSVFIGAVEDTWLHIGKSALLAAGVPEASPNDARGTYLEIIGQATSTLATAIAERIESPVSSLPPNEAKPARGDGSGMHTIEIVLGEPPARLLYVAFSRDLEATCATPKAGNRELAEGGKPESKYSALPGKSRTFDLLMEVELPVSVSFGRAQLPLREVLKLNSGSIVELNRTISDPVEIIVNNCVIARGEVVVVEGNYGVRIHQVISREERLRTLK
jgi:flagellar motor switch protein FliN